MTSANNNLMGNYFADFRQRRGFLKVHEIARVKGGADNVCFSTKS